MERGVARFPPFNFKSFPTVEQYSEGIFQRNGNVAKVIETSPYEHTHTLTRPIWNGRK